MLSLDGQILSPQDARGRENSPNLFSTLLGSTCDPNLSPSEAVLLFDLHFYQLGKFTSVSDLLKFLMNVYRISSSAFKSLIHDKRISF